MTSSNYVVRHVDAALDTLLTELPAIMLTGPRACGKTTTAERRAKSVLRLDRGDVATAFLAAPDAVLAAQPLPVLVDEWQRADGSMGAIKRAVDTGQGPGRYLITGSVRSRLSKARWPVTGRVVPLKMYGLTVAEAEGTTVAADTVVARLFGDVDPVPGTLRDAPDLLEYVADIVRGGFPEAIGLSSYARGLWYAGYVEQLARHDVADLDTVRSPQGLIDLLRAVALNTAGLPAVQSLAQAAGLDHRTVVAYLDLLEDLGIIQRVRAWSSNKLTRLVKTPKYHVIDTGLAAHLSGDDAAGILQSGDRLGRLMDSFVLSQLRPLLAFANPPVAVYHLRDGNGQREVDLVLESAAGDIVGIEVKAANAVTMKAAKHLMWLRDQLGARFRRGIVLHTGAMIYPLSERVWAMPVAALWR
ncbi:MAG: ATP-binding protein [Bifidobacteriaceae bacterium]|nr:ATP-binding protein [Bifidobacteriaceae bacterium]